MSIASKVDRGDLLGAYLAGLDPAPPLRPDEEADLAKRMAAGRAAEECRETQGVTAGLDGVVRDGRRARTRMVRANLPLVVAAARRQGVPAGGSLLDLVQDGNVGLLRAVDRFDAARGYRFSTYAMWWIRQAMLRADRCPEAAVRIPPRAFRRLARARAAERDLSAGRDGHVHFDEVALTTGMDPDELAVLRRAAAPAVRLHSRDVLDSVEGVVDGLGPAPEDAGELGVLTLELGRALGRLGREERELISFRYGLGGRRPHSLAELSRETGLAKETLRRREQAVLGQLREAARGRLG